MIHPAIPRLCAAAPVITLVCAACAGVPSRLAPVRIPGHMTEDGRFIAEPVTASGERLRLTTNTGSGPAILYSDVADRLGLAVDSVRSSARPDVWVRRAPMPAFRPGASIPAPLAGRGARPLLVSPRSRDAEPSMHGYLGSPWFARRTWTFDFARGELLLRAPGDLPRAHVAHRVRLGFKTRWGRRVDQLPRIRVEIGGDSIDLLLATGMDEVVSEEGLRAMGASGEPRQALSSVEPDVIERWRARHPEWRVIEDAVDDGLWALIEVPEVRLAGHSVGPVWFAGSGAGAGWLSNRTDVPVEGFLAANALRFFRLSVDFERGIAVFELPSYD